MKKIILIITVLLLCITASFSVDHFLGTKCLSADFCFADINVHTGLAYEAKILPYFGIAHYFTIGISLPFFSFGFGATYDFVPVFKVGKKIHKFLVSAGGVGVHIAFSNNFGQKYATCKFGLYQSFGVEFHFPKYPAVICKMEFYARGLGLWRYYNQIIIDEFGDTYADIYNEIGVYPVSGGVSFSILFNVNAFGRRKVKYSE